jgi:hypothetical protein
MRIQYLPKEELESVVWMQHGGKQAGSRSGWAWAGFGRMSGESMLLLRHVALALLR